MTFTINKKWRIVSDSLCWKVQKWTKGVKGKGGYDWKTETYHTRISHALESLADQDLRECRASTFEGAANRLLALTKDVRAALEPRFRVEMVGPK